MHFLQLYERLLFYLLFGRRSPESWTIKSTLSIDVEMWTGTNKIRTFEPVDDFSRARRAQAQANIAAARPEVPDFKPGNISYGGGRVGVISRSAQIFPSAARIAPTPAPQQSWLCGRGSRSGISGCHAVWLRSFTGVTALVAQSR